MTWKNLSKVGVIGAGSFGTAIANILAENNTVLVYVRSLEKLKVIDSERACKGQKLHKNIQLTNDLPSFFESCMLIYPMVDSKNFRDMCKAFSSYMRPDHVLIHGTKGLSVNYPVGYEEMDPPQLTRKHINTMTEVIRQETTVLRVGCLSGPNLAKELSAKKPAATVIASRFDEVIELGQQTLRNERFRVYGSHDVLGVELAGVLKNVMAIASGIADGLDMGHNAKAMLLTRGLGEMIRLTKALGSDAKAFFGMAGIGDLIATATSDQSRNYTFGMRLAQGETLEQIQNTMPELAEGVRTIQIMQQISRFYKLHAPITQMLHAVVFDGFEIERAINYLMKYPYAVDVDFL